MVFHTYNPRIRELREEDCSKFKANLGYILSSRPDKTQFKTKQNKPPKESTKRENVSCVNDLMSSSVAAEVP